MSASRLAADDASALRVLALACDAATSGRLGEASALASAAGPLAADKRVKRLAAWFDATISELSRSSEAESA